MFLLSLFRVSNFFISDYNPTILEFLRISIHIKYFSSSYVTCTSQNNDIYDISRKRKFYELEEEFKEFNEFIELTPEEFNEYKKIELISLTNMKNSKTEDLIISSAFLQEQAVNFENFIESYGQEDLDLLFPSIFYQKKRQTLKNL